MEDDDKSLKGETSDSIPLELPERADPWLEKRQRIQEACLWRDAQALRDLACSDGGLLSDELRRMACRYLTSDF
jgi:hypothetical protein